MRRTGQEEMDIGNHFFFEPANTLNASLFSPALTAEISPLAGNANQCVVSELEAHGQLPVRRCTRSEPNPM